MKLTHAVSAFEQLLFLFHANTFWYTFSDVYFVYVIIIIIAALVVFIHCDFFVMYYLLQ